MNSGESATPLVPVVSLGVFERIADTLDRIADLMQQAQQPQQQAQQPQQQAQQPQEPAQQQPQQHLQAQGPQQQAQGPKQQAQGPKQQPQQHVQAQGPQQQSQSLTGSSSSRQYVPIPISVGDTSSHTAYSSAPDNDLFLNDGDYEGDGDPETRCGVCHGQCDPSNMFALLNCGHFPYCGDCVESLKSSNDSTITCPACMATCKKTLKLHTDRK